MSHATDQSILDEAYQRLHLTGPERQGWNSNHGPMAVEALAFRGQAERIHPWVDSYLEVLEEFPTASDPITRDTWRDALGDPKRLGDWPNWFRNELAEAPWTVVLANWWPILIPGIATSATHGVIRVGHAVRTLREQGANPQHLEELAQALGYWAARWQATAGATKPNGESNATEALAQVEAIPEQIGSVNSRLAQLEQLPNWGHAQKALRPVTTAEQVPSQLQDIVTAAVYRYRHYGHADPIMLVHAATAPNAVLRTLPSLPTELWVSSANYAWTACTAVTASYFPSTALDESTDVHSALSVSEIFDLAAATGDPHAIKFADTAIDVHKWTADTAALASAAHATKLIVA